MNYDRIYNNIINKRRQEVFSGYTEKHHIIPRSLGGNDTTENLVDLSAREHFLCHYLLVKMQKPDTIAYYKMLNAFIMMKASSLNNSRYFNARLYEKYKTKFSKHQSNTMKGNKNHRYNSKWMIHPKTLHTTSVVVENIDYYLGMGYIFGRTIKKSKQLERQEYFKTKAYEIFNDWQKSGKTITEYSKISKWNMTQQSMSKLMRKHVNEYQKRYRNVGKYKK